jgi:hypothetical protein
MIKKMGHKLSRSNSGYQQKNGKKLVDAVKSTPHNAPRNADEGNAINLVRLPISPLPQKKMVATTGIEPVTPAL